jgi:molybdate transport system substrate-binding protein
MTTRVRHFSCVSLFIAVLLVAVFVCSCAVPALAATTATGNGISQKGILIQAAKVYAGPGTTSKVLFTVKKDARIAITGHSGAWLAINTWLGKTGYIYSKYVTVLAVVPVVQPARVSLTISAAASMTDAMNTIQKLYQAANPNVTLTMNYASSGTLEQQIEQGAPADVFISAADKQMDMLEKKSLVLAGTRKVLVRNHLVLIVPKGSTAVTSFDDLTKAAVKFFAIGEPSSVPAGQYAQESLTTMGLWDALQSKLVRGKDVRAVLTYVATRNADAGLVYSTDARTSRDVRVVTYAPEDSHSPIVYPIAVINTSKNQTAAKAFVAYLSGAFATAVFRSYGFVVGN